MKEREKIDWIVKTINEDQTLQNDAWILFDSEDAELLRIDTKGITVLNPDGLIDAYQDYLAKHPEINPKENLSNNI